MKAVKVVGLGAVCANGLNKEDIFDSVLGNSSAVAANGLASLSDSAWNLLLESTPTDIHQSRCSLLGWSSLTAALTESGWTAEDIAGSGFIFASTTSQIDQWESYLPSYELRHRDDGKIRHGIGHQSLGTPALRFADAVGSNGPRAMIASSCSASLQAIVMASLWIRSGKVKRCLVGATEIHSELTTVGFGSLRLLSKEICSPFDRNRTGINLGEGSAFLCLEESSLRDDLGWGFATGGGLSTDAFHPTSPHPEGRGSQLAMNMALKSAHLAASTVDWIYAHGTGSPANDLAESMAIKAVFPHQPFVTSTKSSHGHTLAASGAIESVLGLMAMKEQKILPTYHLQEIDPQITLKIPLQAVDHNIQHFLKNSLGFGGINASVVFSKEGPQT